MEVSAKCDNAIQSLASLIQGDRDDAAENGSQSETSDDCRSGHPSRPRDRHAFFQRVHTFSYLTWVAKPPWLSPLECARYGWENVDVDWLRCVSCKAQISGRMPVLQCPKVYDKACHRLIKSLRDGHSPTCPWTSCPSPEYFLQLPYDTRSQAREVLSEQFQSLSRLGEQLPLITENTLETMNLTVDQIEQLLLECPASADLPASVAQSAAILSVTGWTTSSTNRQQLATAHCTLCNRHIGTWNFFTLAQPSDETENKEDDSNKVRETGPSKNGLSHNSDGGSIRDINFVRPVDEQATNGDCLLKNNGTVEPEALSNESSSDSNGSGSSEKLMIKGKSIDAKYSPLEDRNISSAVKMSTCEQEPEAVLPEVKNKESLKGIMKGHDEDITADMYHHVSDTPDTKSKEPQELFTHTAEQMQTPKDEPTEPTGMSVLSEKVTAKGKPAPEKIEVFTVESNGKSPLHLGPTQEDCNQGNRQGQEEMQHKVSYTRLVTEEGLPAAKVNEQTDPESIQAQEPPAKKQKTCSDVQATLESGKGVTYKRRKTAFMPLREHHTWCPWVAGHQPRSINSPGYSLTDSPRCSEKEGWRQLLYLLLPKLSPNWHKSMQARARTRSPDVLRSIRRLFNELASPVNSR